MLDMDKLKAEALELGVQYSPNIGAATLRKKIDDFVISQEIKVEKSAVETPAMRRTRLIMEANKLTRVIVTPLDPAIQDHNCILAIGSNAIVGTITQYVPFNVEWYVAKLPLNVLREKVYTVQSSKSGGSRKELPKVNITVLDDITPAELKKLREQQSLRNASLG